MNRRFVQAEHGLLIVISSDFGTSCRFLLGFCSPEILGWLVFPCRAGLTMSCSAVLKQTSKQTVLSKIFNPMILLRIMKKNKYS
jgi:hypothetical protein